MGRGREKEVQYKETAVFELFPALEYTKAQKQRLILFHAYKNNIRRIINYAAHFDKPNCLCMAYIVGEVAPEKIQKLLADAECSDRVCVLTSAYPDSDMAFWRDFDKRREIMRKQGFWDDEAQALNDNFRQHYETTAQWVELIEADTPDVDGQIGLDAFQFQQGTRLLESVENDLRKCDETLEAVKRYHALAKKAPTHFRRWTIHRRGQEPTPFRHADTDKLIAKIYPYGAEARGVNPYAGLSPASAEAAVKLIVDGAENKRLGFTRDEIMQSTAARKIRKFVHDAIAASGYCSLFDLKDFIQSPPFGLGYNGYSAAILSAALSEEDGLIYRDSVSDSDVKRNMYGLFLLLFVEGRYSAAKAIEKKIKLDRRSYLPCLYKEFRCHKTVRRALADLYGVPDDWEGNGILVRCRGRIEEMFRLPLFMSDELLYYLTGPEICWYERAEMERLAAQVKARRDELPRILAAHIAKDKRIPTREWIPGAACWLWGRDALYDGAYCMASASELEPLRENDRKASDLFDKAQDLMIRITTLSLHGEDDKIKPLIEEREKILAEAQTRNKRNQADWAILRDVCRGRLEALCGKSP